jgi:chromosome partitioning protein
MSAKIFAIANQKGGVGKTTTTINLASAMALHGFKTLIIDMDPQANATSALGVEKKPDHGIYSPLAHGSDPVERIVKTNYKNLFIIPSELDLAAAERELSSQDNYLLKLKNCLEKIKEKQNFSTIFIDCPPTLGLLSMNSLCAADSLLVTLQCEYMALEGLGQIIDIVKQLKEAGANPDLNLGGIIMTMFNRTKLSQEVVNEVSHHYKNEIFETIIPRTVRLSEAPSFGKSIFDYDPKGTGSISYNNLARELIVRFDLKT